MGQQLVQAQQRPALCAQSLCNRRSSLSAHRGEAFGTFVQRGRRHRRAPGGLCIPASACELTSVTSDPTCLVVPGLLQICLCFQACPPSRVAQAVSIDVQAHGDFHQPQQAGWRRQQSSQTRRLLHPPRCAAVPDLAVAVYGPAVVDCIRCSYPLRTQGKAAERGGTAVVLEAEGHEDEDEDMPVPPPEEPDSDAPHFTAWPEQRGFGQVVADKAGDTIQVRRGCRAGVAWAGGRDLCTSCQSVRFCTNWYATSVWRGRATHASSQGSCVRLQRRSGPALCVDNL